MANHSKRLEEIAQELHDIANDYAGDETGIVASLLHLSGGNIQQCLKALNGEQPLDPMSVSLGYARWEMNCTLLSLPRLFGSQ